MNGDDPSARGGQRVYVRRRGRMTRAQARALETLSSRYVLTLDESAGFIDPESVFGRNGPLGLEIGFGMGQALVAWAQERPDWNLLGLEVYQPGIGSAMLGLEREGVDNVRLVEARAEDVLGRHVAPGTLDEVRVFFPDPWPKKRHHKRRMLQREFVRLLASRLKPGGLLWVATDWEEYGQSMVAVLDSETTLTRVRPPVVGDGEQDRPRTRFESRGLRLGHRVWDLRYRRKRSSTVSR